MSNSTQPSNTPIRSYIVEGDHFVSNGGAAYQSQSAAIPLTNGLSRFKEGTMASSIDNNENSWNLLPDTVQHLSLNNEQKSNLADNIQYYPLGGPTNLISYQSMDVISGNTTSNISNVIGNNPVSTSTSSHSTSSNGVTTTYDSQGRIATQTTIYGTDTYKWITNGSNTFSQVTHVNSTLANQHQQSAQQSAAHIEILDGGGDPSGNYAEDHKQSRFVETFSNGIHVLGLYKEAYDAQASALLDPTELPDAVEKLHVAKQAENEFLTNEAASGNRLAQAELDKRNLPQRITGIKNP